MSDALGAAGGASFPPLDVRCQCLVQRSAHGWIDFIDGLNEFMPRRWKRWLSLAILIAFLAFPSEAQRAVLWYGQEKARQITEWVVPLLLPTVTPTPSHSPSIRPT